MTAALTCTASIAQDETGFYKGNYGPDADYILSGGLIRDLPQALAMPVDYKGDGFAAKRLSDVPPPGVHPRVIMSPSDVERMKELVAMGDKAPRFFRIHLEALRRDRDWQIPQNYNYITNPFGQDGKIAGWALLALLTDDQELGRKAAKATLEHALFMEPRIDILNTLDAAKPLKQVSYDFVRTGLRFGPFTYIQAYHDGGKERVEELRQRYGVELAHTGDHTGAYYALGWEYDYAYSFMSDEERAIVRRVIAKSTYGKYDTGMALPGQMYINNHMSSGANWIALALAIEGEEGYDERILPIALWSLKNKLTYDLSPDGITYENTKGFIPMLPVLACARRQGADDPEQLLKHSHLVARAYSNVQHARKLYNRYIGRHRYREGTPQLHEVKTGLDEPRYWRASGGSGSGGHHEFWYVVKYFYPNDPMVDFVYSAKNSDYNAELYEGREGERYGSRLHYSWFNLPALCMLTASHDTDYNRQDRLDQFEDLPEFWFDEERGMVAMRSGWDQDAMLVHMENRIDQYYSGHETPQHGDFQVWADGIPWSPNLGAYRDCTFRAMVTVDGLAGVYCPVSGDWMTAHDTPEAATSVAEMTTAYQWRKLSKLLHLDHPALEQAPLKMAHFAEAAYTQDRFTELPHLPKVREHYDGFAHLDYGPWHGETRGPERYGKWNDPMRYVFRTIHFARGKKPYLLVFDDLDKDGRKHQYDWRMPVIGDSEVYLINPAPQNRHLELNTEGVIGTDIILALADDRIKRDRGAVWGTVYPRMKPQPKKGDPMLLVRVLWRNTNFPYPFPHFQKYWEYNMISVPAYSESPAFKVLIFPHRFGDKLPVTTWSDDMGKLTVKVGENMDVYNFDQTDRKRTVFTMSRNGRKITDSGAAPPRPILRERGKWTVDQNRPNWRQPRAVVGTATAEFAVPAPGAEIRYTLDGSTPGADSAVYTAPLTIDRSCTLQARTYQPDWRCGGEGWSKTASFRFEKQLPASSVPGPALPGSVPGAALPGSVPGAAIPGSVPGAALPGSVPGAAPAPGLSTRGYEIKTTIFDRKGFFQGSKSSLPDVSLYEPLVATITPGFDIPFMEPQQPRKLMTKAFYLFEGYFNAPATGVYYFEVASCGPVDFSVAGREVILVNRQYGLSYKKRYGEVGLAEGRHALRLLVCDTMFWKGDIEEPYKIGVQVKGPGSNDYLPIANAALSCVAPARLTAIREHRALKKHAGQELAVVPGVVQEKYDRIARSPERLPADGLPPAFFDVDGLAPYASALVERMAANDSTRKLVEYKGFLRIAADGVYEFRLHQGRESSAQLLVHDQIIVRQRVAAPAAAGRIRLGRGLHPFRLQVALGKAVIHMKAEGESVFQTAGVAALARPAAVDLGQVNTSPDRELVAYLPCDELADGLTPIQFGKGATATVQAGVLVPGKKGRALGMYEAASQISLRNLPTHEDSSTISCWIMLKESSDFYILTGVPYMSEAYDLRFRRNRFVAEFRRGIGVVNATVDKDDVATGKWFHVAATYGEENSVYFNGELIGSAQVHNKTMRRGSAREPNVELMVCPGRPTNAAIDECRVYNRVLTAEEVKALYEADK